jgi:glutathione S-transferase
VRLFYRAQTGRPLRVAWALEEIGVDYEPVALSAEACRDGAYRRRHPLGRVPALELDDRQVLFESTAIVVAIADLYPDAGLTGPLGSPLRTQVYAWSIMAMTELERTTLGAWSRTEHVEDEYRRRQLRAFARASAALGDQLADQPFLLGTTLTAADIVLGGVLAVSRFAGVLDAAPAQSSTTSIVCKRDLLTSALWRALNRCSRCSAGGPGQDWPRATRRLREAWVRDRPCVVDDGKP